MREYLNWRVVSQWNVCNLQQDVWLYSQFLLIGCFLTGGNIANIFNF